MGKKNLNEQEHEQPVDPIANSITFQKIGWTKPKIIGNIRQVSIRHK